MLLFRRGIQIIRKLHTEKDYVLVKAEKKDIPAIEKFAVEIFFKNEIACIMTGVASKPRPSDALIEDLVRVIPDDLSFIAKRNEADPEILGMGLSLIRPPVHEPDYLHDLMSRLTDEKEKQLVEFLAKMGLEPINLPKSYYGDVENIAEMKSAAIHPSFYRKGVAEALRCRAMEEFKIKGFKIVRADCTNAFTAKLVRQAGMEVVHELKYEDYKDSNGNHIFKNKIMEPHKSYCIFLEKLE